MPRFMGFVRMEEGIGVPPQSLFDAMDVFIGERAANGSFVDGGGLGRGDLGHLGDGRRNSGQGRERGGRAQQALQADEPVHDGLPRFFRWPETSRPGLACQ